MPKLLVVLCAYLGLWVPLNFAVLASQSLASLGARGLAAVVEIGVNVVAAVLCVVAGRMLWSGSPSGRRFALLALIVNLAVSLQGLFGSALPRNVSPGTAPVLAALTTAHALVWILYLTQSRSLRAWIEG